MYQDSWLAYWRYPIPKLDFTKFCCWAGPGVPIPEHPYPGQKWREVRHDNTVTWLAYWKDPISHKDYKYVWLAANSLFKSDSDLAKYEKARKLKVRRHPPGPANKHAALPDLEG